MRLAAVGTLLSCVAFAAGADRDASSSAGNPEVKATEKTVKKYFPLGIGNGCISNEAFTASSSYNEPGAEYGPHLARLNMDHEPGVDVGWRPAEKDSAPWWQVDLGGELIVTGIVTQGGFLSAHDHKSRRPAWTSSYQLLSSLDGASWAPYGSELAGNMDARTPALRLVNAHTVEPLRARYLRIQPLSCGLGPSHDGKLAAETGPVTHISSACALRVGIMGHSPCRRARRCDAPAELGVREGGFLVPASFSASSHATPRTPAHAGRLHHRAKAAAEGGWAAGCPAAGPCKPPARPESSLDFLQVDLGRELEIRAVATQGSASRPAWVTSYDMAFSNDGLHWAMSAQRFVGNADALTRVKNVLPRPVLARYVRVIPVAWDGVGPAADFFFAALRAVRPRRLPPRRDRLPLAGWRPVAGRRGSDPQPDCRWRTSTRLAAWSWRRRSHGGARP